MQEHAMYTVTQKLFKGEADNFGSLKWYLWVGEVWKAPNEHSGPGAFALEAGKMGKCEDHRGHDKG